MNEKTSDFTVAAANFLVDEYGDNAAREAAEIVLLQAGASNRRGRRGAVAILQVVIAIQGISLSGLLN
jgi:hypothetical protein